MIFLVIFILFRVTVPNQLYCSKDENLFLPTEGLYFEILDQNLSVMNQKKHLNVSESINLSKINCSLSFGEIYGNTESMLIFYKCDKEYIIQELKLEFLVINNSATLNYDIVYERNITFDNNNNYCDQLYLKSEILYMICQDQDRYIIYMFKKVNEQISELQLKKKQECDFVFKLLFYYIIISEQNCFEWHVQIFHIFDDKFELYREIDFHFYNQKLKNIVPSQTFKEIFLQFENRIYGTEIENESIRLEIEQVKKILGFYQDFATQIILQTNSCKIDNFTNFVTDQYNIEHIFISVQEDLEINLKQIYIDHDFLVLIYETHFLFLSSYSSQWEKYDIALKGLQNYAKTNFFLGFDGQQGILFVRIENIPLINCNEITKTTNINIKQFYIYESNIETTKLEINKIIENQLVQNNNFYKFEIEVNKQEIGQYPIQISDFFIGQPANYQINSFERNLEIQLIENEYIIFCQPMKRKIFSWWRIILIIALKWKIWEYIQSQIKQFQIMNLIRLFYSGKNNKDLKKTPNEIIIFKVVKQLVKFEKVVKEIFSKKNHVYIQFEDCSAYTIDSMLQIIKQNQKYKYYYRNQWNCLNFQQNFDKVIFHIQDKRTIVLQAKIEIEIADIQILTYIANQQRSELFTLIYKNIGSDLIHVANYLLKNYQFIKMFDYPQFGLKYEVPLNHQIQDKYILIMAYNSSNNDKFILIYEMFQIYANSLKYIIKVNSSNFQSFQNRVIYTNNNLIYSKFFDQEKILVKLNKMDEWRKTYNISINAQSIFDNISLQLNSTLEVINQIDQIKTKYQSININSKQLKYFDPRLYVQGFNLSISSNDFIIQNSMKIINIYYTCQFYVKSVCFSQINATIKPFIESNFTLKILSVGYQIFRSNNYFFLAQNNQIIISKLKEDKKNAFIFDSTIQIENDGKIFDIIVVNEIIFIILNVSIKAYQIMQDTCKFLNDINFNCHKCKILEAENDHKLFLIYNSMNNYNATLIMINTSLTILKENIEFNTEPYLKKQELNLIFLQSFLLNQHNYFEITAIYFKLKKVGYVIQFIMNQQNYEITNSSIISYVRYPHGTQLEDIIQLDNNLYIFYQSDYSTTLLQLYNLSQPQNFQMIDPIQNQQLENCKISLYNSTSLFLILPKDANNTKLINIKSYEIELKNASLNKINITFSNQVSSQNITFIILDNAEEQNLQFQDQILFVSICIFSLIFLIMFYVKKVKNRNAIPQNGNEIELSL